MTQTSIEEQATAKDLYGIYTDECRRKSVEPKSITSFANKAAIKAALDSLVVKEDAPPPPAGVERKLTPAMRARARRLQKAGKINHKWGDKWVLTDEEWSLLTS